MSVVLDSSAVLAVIFDEDGAARVAPALKGGLLSCVNLAEVVTRLIDEGYAEADVAETCEKLGAEIVPFGPQQAVATGLLRARCGKHVSLGDRACLALAADRALPVLTGDRPWATLDLGVEIELIR